ncbi:MAG: SigB/SigF/SigG family RNA polymerase sigma factor [Clostridia bacterium]|nr:SigB/SigF/SigG family RNA polymerase sigma factor [Clostridia bacterium]
MSGEAHESDAREKLLRAREGDAAAREEVIRENLPLVKYVAKRFTGRGVEYEDLVQYGCVGLLKAVDRFDPEYPVRFSTYAVPVIMGEIRRFLRDDGPVHISRTIWERARRVEAFVEAYQTEHGRQPAVDEIAEALGLESGDVVLAMNSRGRVRSLEEPVAGDTDLRLMDVLGKNPMAAVDRRLTLARLLEALEPQERALIVRRYFKRHTQANIARDMGVTQVQVSRLESRILKRMREQAGTDGAT